MTTPEALRALAARVVAGEATNEEIALALGWHPNYGGSPVWWHTSGEWRIDCLAFLTSLDASARAMPSGWRVSLHQDDDGQWNATGIPQPYEPGRSISERAPTEPPARIALALLCTAAEQEKGPDA